MADNMKEALDKAGMKLPQTNQVKNQPLPMQQGTPKQTDEFEDYTTRAEKVILELRNERDFSKFTTSKIRNILSLVTDIYNDVLSEKSDTLSSDIQNRILHLKVRLIYECGRESIIKLFYQKAGLQQIINGIGNGRERFMSFARYIEALVAYHRFYGGRD